MQRAILTVVAYIAATFAVQATSHFGINAAHYAQLAHLRPEPIMPMGVASMLVQGIVMAWLYARLEGAGTSVWHAIRFAWIMGAFLVSYIALAEAAKYVVPSIGAWLTVETIAGFCQFTLFGLLLGLLHRRAVRGAVPAKG